VLKLELTVIKAFFRKSSPRKEEDILIISPQPASPTCPEEEESFSKCPNRSHFEFQHKPLVSEKIAGGTCHE
jgi:hypothetical protein